MAIVNIVKLGLHFSIHCGYTKGNECRISCRSGRCVRVRSGELMRCARKGLGQGGGAKLNYSFWPVRVNLFPTKNAMGAVRNSNPRVSFNKFAESKKPL